MILPRRALVYLYLQRNRDLKRRLPEHLQERPSEAVKIAEEAVDWALEACTGRKPKAQSKIVTAQC